MMIVMKNSSFTSNEDEQDFETGKWEEGDHQLCPLSFTGTLEISHNPLSSDPTPRDCLDVLIKQDDLQLLQRKQISAREICSKGEN